MDKYAPGFVKRIRGDMKETVGKAVGDPKLQVEGKLDKAAGKIEKAVADTKDAVRKSVDKT
jgi:uncharacterized protein YjbJ (UPF0337 family)